MSCVNNPFSLGSKASSVWKQLKSLNRKVQLSTASVCTVCNQDARKGNVLSRGSNDCPIGRMFVNIFHVGSIPTDSKSLGKFATLTPIRASAWGHYIASGFMTLLVSVS